MVKVGVALAGGILSAVGTGLMVGIAVMETFVVVSVPGVPGCDETPLAQVGVFTSSYDPACTIKDVEVYATYSKIAVLKSVPTTEFTLLFPSQTGFGGLYGEVGEFTTCEEFYAPGGATEDTIANYVIQDAIFPGSEAGIVAQRDGSIALLGLASAALPGAVSGLVSTLYAGGVTSALQSFQDAGNAVKFLAVSIFAAAATSASPCFTPAMTGNYSVECSAGGDTISGLLLGFAGYDCALPSGDSNYDATYNGLCNNASPPGASLQSAVQLYAQSTGNGASAASVLFVGLFQLDSSVPAADVADWSGVSAFIAGYTGNAGSPQNAQFNSAQALFGLCPIATTAGCAGFYVTPTNLTVANSADALCVLTGLDYLQAEADRLLNPNDEGVALGTAVQTSIAATNTYVTGCSFQKAAKVFLANAENVLLQATFSAALAPASVDTGILRTVMEVIDQCTDTLSTCFGDFVAAATVDFSGIPVDMRASYIPARLSNMGDSSANPEFSFFSLMIGGAAAPGASSSAIAAGGVFRLCKTKADLMQAPLSIGLGLCGCTSSGCADPACATAVSGGDLTYTTSSGATVHQTIVAFASNNCSVSSSLDGLCALDNDAKDIQSAAGYYAMTQATAPSTYVTGEYWKKANCFAGALDIINEFAGIPIPAFSVPASALRAGLVGAGSSALIAGATAEERIASCEDDEKDKEIFATAQKMIPAAIALAAIGTLVTFAAVSTKKMPVALAGGVLAILGAGVLLGALLLVRTAPVYALVGGDKIQKKPYYAGGMAQTLALGAIAAPVIGGLLTAGSAFCDKDAEGSSALTSKVDNTY